MAEQLPKEATKPGGAGEISHRQRTLTRRNGPTVKSQRLIKAGMKMNNGDLIRNMRNEELAFRLMCPNEMGMAEIACDQDDACNCCQCSLD